MAEVKVWRKSFSDYVRTLQARAQLTQAELAVQLQVTPNTIARWASDNPALAREAYGEARERLVAYAREYGLPPLPERRLRHNPLKRRKSPRKATSDVDQVAEGHSE